MVPFSFVPSALTVVPQFLQNTIPHLPPDSWWVPALVLAVLLLTAVVDAFTGYIPNLAIFPATVAMFYLNWSLISLPLALTHLGWGIGLALAVWAFNTLWFAIFKQDAIGLGDGKWTMLAVSCFGPWPGIMAWGLGACLAVLWLTAAILTGRKVVYVYFAPFLFTGLLGGLIWLHMGVWPR